jgi:hypothetical protein
VTAFAAVTAASRRPVSLVRLLGLFGRFVNDDVVPLEEIPVFCVTESMSGAFFVIEAVASQVVVFISLSLVTFAQELTVNLLAAALASEVAGLEPDTSVALVLVVRSISAISHGSLLGDARFVRDGGLEVSDELDELGVIQGSKGLDVLLEPCLGLLDGELLRDAKRAHIPVRE